MAYRKTSKLPGEPSCYMRATVVLMFMFATTVGQTNRPTNGQTFSPTDGPTFIPTVGPTASSWSKNGLFYTPASVKYVEVLGSSVDGTLDILAQELHLNCSAEGSPILSYEWRVNGTHVDTSNKNVSLGPEGNLTIKHPSLADEGIYQCFVSNEFGTEFSSNLTVKFAVSGKFLSKNNVQVKATVGKALLVRCPRRTYSFGARYRWIPTGHSSLVDKPRVLPLANGDLLFSYVTEKDVTNSSGLRCQMEHGHLNNKDPVIETSANIFLIKDGVSQANFTPSFVRVPQDYHAYEGERLVLSCTATGRPTPSIDWFKDGQLIEVFDEINNLFYIENFGRNLVSENVNSAHAGQYKCVAKNVVSSVSADFTVTVGEKPKIISCGDKRMTGDFGGSVTLTCETAGKPNPTIVVYHNGIPLLDSISKDRVTHLSLSTVEISNLRLSDNGTYQCVATNKFGTAMCSGFLIVKGSPLPPSNLSVTDCANYTTTLSWVINDINKATKNFVIEYTANSRSVSPRAPKDFTRLDDVSDDLTRSHRLRKLPPYADVSFRMRAVNNIGASFPSLPTHPMLCRTRGRAPDSFPRNIILITPVQASMLNISWKPLPPLKHNGPGCKYVIHYKAIDEQQWYQSTTVSCEKKKVGFFVSRPHVVYEVKLQVRNEHGLGPESVIYRQFSGQNPPYGAPYPFGVVGVTATTVDLAWSPPFKEPVTIDGYLVHFWEGKLSQLNDEGCLECDYKRRKRSLSLALSGSRSSRNKWKSLFHAITRRSIRAPEFNSPGSLLITALTQHRLQKRSLIEPVHTPDMSQIRFVNTTKGTVTGLKPYTSYIFKIQGYNSGGSGQPNTLSVSTLDTKVSYYVMTLAITSETFTDELKNMSSGASLELAQRLERSVKLAYSDPQSMWWFKGVKVLSFSPGSVVSSIQVAASSPNMSEIMGVIAGASNLGEFAIDVNASGIQGEQDITVHIRISPASTVQVGADLVFNCSAPNAPMEATFEWQNNNSSSAIGLGFRTKIQSGPRFSLLTIRAVAPEDNGQYSCYVRKGIAIFENSVNIYVLPVIKISPMAATIVEGQSVTFSCSVESGNITGTVLEITETTASGVVRHASSSLSLTSVGIPTGEEINVRMFTCELWGQNNERLVESESAKLVVVRAAVSRCPEETKDGVRWSATVPGSSDVKPCPAPARGSATRECLSNDQTVWGPTNFINCSSGEFIQLGSEAEALGGGFQPNLNAQNVLNKLVNITSPLANDSTRPNEIYGGDLEISTDILANLAKYNSEKGSGSLNNPSERENFVRAASNLLEKANKKSWLQLDEEGKNTSNILVSSLDVYGLEVARSLDGVGKDAHAVVEERNVVMRVDNIADDSQIKTEGFEFAYQKNKIFLPSEVFQRVLGQSRVASFVYLTLNDIFLIEKPATFSRGQNTDGRDDDAKLPATSTLVSSTVSPSPPSELQSSVKIVLENKKVKLPSDASPLRSCVFWRVGLPRTWQTSGCRLVSSESDDNVTTCECDHLTVFASLMDPYGAPLPSEHKKALEIISIVGCAISAVAVLLTAGVTLYFWRYLKSPRSKVLVNICAAVAITCILVICEGWARDNKIGCTVVAALLHYFLLAMFAWMLCEGILLYLLLVQVFGGGAEDAVKYFYALGWGLPAIVVAISLGVTQTSGYGSTEVCWLSTDSGLIWAFVAPAVVVILVNLVIFILVLRQMMGTKAIQDKERIEKIRTGTRASAVILPLLGITWIFGLLSFNSSTLAFKYIFAIMNSLQGLMIFIFHCVLNKQIRDAFKRISDKTRSAASNTQDNRIRNKRQHSDSGNTKTNPNGNEYEMMTSNKRNTLSTFVPRLSQSLQASPIKHDIDLMKGDVVIQQPGKSSNSEVQAVQDLQSDTEAMKEPDVEHLEYDYVVSPGDLEIHDQVHSVTPPSSPAGSADFLLPITEKVPEVPHGPDAGQPGETLLSAHLESAPTTDEPDQRAEGAFLHNEDGPKEEDGSQREKNMVHCEVTPRRKSSSYEAAVSDEDFVRWMTKRRVYVDSIHEVGQRFSLLRQKPETNLALRRWTIIRTLVVEGRFPRDSWF